MEKEIKIKTLILVCHRGYYVCTMIEYVARVTNNRRRDIVRKCIL